MMPTVIYNRTPMQDYQEIQSSARYTLSASPSEPMTFTNNEENLKETSFYKFSITAIKLIFIFAGVCLVIFLCQLPAILKTDERPLPEPLRSVVTYDMLTFFALIFGGLAWMVVMALLEHHSWNKDIKAGINRDTKTWILNDRRIAVSDEQGGNGRQCINGILGYIRISGDQMRPMEHYPFHKLEIVNKVYNISRGGGIIAADADITVLYLKFPLSDDGSSQSIYDNVDLFYNYYRVNRRGKIKWYENMYGKEILLQSLEMLKTHE